MAVWQGFPTVGREASEPMLRAAGADADFRKFAFLEVRDPFA
jgi:hypothetical protein